MQYMNFIMSEKDKSVQTHKGFTDFVLLIYNNR